MAGPIWVHDAAHVRRNRLSFSGLVALISLLTLVLAGCGGANTSRAAVSGSPTPTPTTAPDLRVECLHPGTPVLQSGARLTLTPDHGPVGTQVSVEATGIQPGCHLLLGIAAAPALAETNNTPVPAPRLADEALQWVAVTDVGSVHTTLCVCQVMGVYPVGAPSYPSVTPVPGAPTFGAYSPHPGDYFFITLAGAGIPNPPPLYARFTVTQ